MQNQLNEFFVHHGGVPPEGAEPDKRKQLLAIKDRVLYSWTKGLRAVVGLKYYNDNSGSVERKCTFDFEVKLNLTIKPHGPVEWIELNKSGNILAICSAHSIYAVFLPRVLWILRSLTDVEKDYLCRCVVVQNDLSAKTNGIKCLRTKWHPGSVLDRHLVSLWSDDVIRVYNISHTSVSPFPVFLRHSNDRSSSGSQSTECRFEDTAVSFDFGAPLEMENDTQAHTWPIFILCSNGDVFSILSDPKENRYGPITGPIRISPTVEDNYGTGSCDIVFLHGSVPLLVIATTYGILYHAFIYRDEEVDTPGSPHFRLHVFESVELEFALSTVDLASKEVKEDTESSNVALLKDPLIPCRYYTIHRAGLHQVELISAHDGNDAILTDASSNVRYMLCTTPKRNANSPDSCPVGLAVLHSVSSESVNIVRLSDSTVYYLPANYDAVSSMISSAKSAGGDAKKTANRDYFIDTVKRLLKKDSTVPVMRGQSDKQITEQDGAELMHRCIESLQKEYIQRLAAAREVCETRVSEQRDTFEQQKRGLERVQTKYNALKQRLAASKNWRDELTKAQKELSERLQRVTEIASGEGIGELSVQEEKMFKELKVLDGDIGNIYNEMSELTERVDSLCVESRGQGDVFGTPRQSQELTVKHRLEEQQRQIESILLTVKALQKELQ